MGFVSRVLPSLKRISEDEMPDAVTIHRGTGWASNAGGAMVASGTSTTSTTGRIGPVDQTDTEAIVSGELRLDGLGKLVLPLATDVLNTDTVTVVSARHGTTVNYTVEGVAPKGTFSVHRKVYVRRA